MALCRKGKLEGKGEVFFVVACTIKYICLNAQVFMV